MDETINYLSSHNVRVLKKGEVRGANDTLGATVGMLWIDVEGTQVGHVIKYHHIRKLI